VGTDVHVLTQELLISEDTHVGIATDDLYISEGTFVPNLAR
jgi:hypothetical protein